VGVALSVGFSGHADALGLTLGLVSALLFAVYFLIAKRTLSTTDLDGVTLTAVTYIAAAVGFPVLMLATGASLPSDTDGWLSVVTIALVGTVVGAVLLFSGLRYLDAGTASMLSAAEPPVAVGLAALLLSEPVASTQIIGMAVVVFTLGMLGYLAARTPAPEVPLVP
jgi:DME family drug/metabolite transporter